MLALLGYGMVITFMILIMTKRMTAFTSLIIVPIIFGLIGGFGLQLGDFAIEGVKGVSKTSAMLLFAILYFGIMINAGLFDPLVKFTVKAVKGDPLKVLVGTAILAAIVSLDGDGTTTTMIVCSALIPVYDKLKIKKLHLATILILQNSIMNLIPWGGPTARVMSALKLESADILAPLLPGMAISLVYVVGVAYYLGLKERKRLGITHIDNAAIEALTETTDEEELALKRPKLILINLALTALMVTTLILDKVPAAIIFEVGTALALLINYPKLKTQRDLIEKHGGSAVQVIGMVLAAGVFMGILTESKMAEAMAQHMITVIPASLAPHFVLITAILSAPGTFFLSNDAFYFGVLPVLAETGAAYGFSALQIGVASLMGQAFHLISPLVAFIYLLLQLTGVDMGEWQRNVAKWAIGVFVIFVASAAAIGFMPL